MFSLLPYLADYLFGLFLLYPLPLAVFNPLLRGLLTRLCNYPLISSKVKPVLDYLFPVIVLP